MGGAHRGTTGKLIGVDGTDGIVKLEDTLDVKILDMGILAKLAQSWFVVINKLQFNVFIIEHFFWWVFSFKLYIKALH